MDDDVSCNFVNIKFIDSIAGQGWQKTPISFDSLNFYILHKNRLQIIISVVNPSGLLMNH